MKRLYRIVSFGIVLSIIMVLGFALPVSAEGITFSKDNIYTVSSAYAANPITIDTVISVPTGIQRTQTVIGSEDGDMTKDHMTLRLNSKGNPVVSFYGPKNATTQQTYSYTFGNVDVRTGKPVGLHYEPTHSN